MTTYAFTMRRTTNSHGFAMLVVLGYVMAITILSTAFLKTVHQSIDTAQAHSRETKTCALAESGIHHAALQLTSNPAFSGDSNVPFGAGVFTTHVQSDQAPNTWTIESTGSMGEAGLHSTTVRATLSKTSGGWKTLRWERVPKSDLNERTES